MDKGLERFRTWTALSRTLKKRCGMNKRMTLVSGIATALLYGALAQPAEGRQSGVAAVLDALNSVHAFGEGAISPDGRHVVYGSVVTGTRGGAEGNVSALCTASAQDGSTAVRLTACPGAACDQHSVAASPRWAQ